MREAIVIVLTLLLMTAGLVYKDKQDRMRDGVLSQQIYDLHNDLDHIHNFDMSAIHREMMRQYIEQQRQQQAPPHGQPQFGPGSRSEGSLHEAQH